MRNIQDVIFDVHHAGVTDHRDGSGMYETARLPIGYFWIETVGKIQSCDLRLDLWNAELVGTVKTLSGIISLRVLIPANVNLLVVEATPDAGERDLRMHFQPLEAISPRIARGRRPKNYPDNPPHELLTREAVQVCLQSLLVDGEYATAWKIREERSTTLFASVAHSFPGTTAVDSAVAVVRRAAANSYDTDDLEVMRRTSL